MIDGSEDVLPFSVSLFLFLSYAISLFVVVTFRLERVTMFPFFLYTGSVPLLGLWTLLVCPKTVLHRKLYPELPKALFELLSSPNFTSFR